MLIVFQTSTVYKICFIYHKNMAQFHWAHNTKDPPIYTMRMHAHVHMYQHTCTHHYIIPIYIVTLYLMQYNISVVAKKMGQPDKILPLLFIVHVFTNIIFKCFNCRYWNIHLLIYYMYMAIKIIHTYLHSHMHTHSHELIMISKLITQSYSI